MRSKWLILVVPILFGFIQYNNLKELDLKSFKIIIPRTWVYKEERGEDSFIGRILTMHSYFVFDFSYHGYANSLIPTEQEYLKKESWLKDCLFCKPGITYTANFNVKSEKARQMKEKGITDSTLVKVEAEPTPKSEIHQPNQKEKIKYPKADYIAKLTYKDSAIILPINIPSEIKNHNIRIDSTNRYIIKTISPKVTGKGITAIYFYGKKDHLTFNLVAANLDAREQEQALTAFKTISIKERADIR
ncbi:hypothetical protein BDD43_4107 [Mucilaginibacter gracilis]|uniref:Uncharacterized protein n=1 Tax=Mucilaginibacter gracilis TaxID=423350 RepID=A0A495J5J0_9SPHI|nr:hypothetical protein [Mucilaginibacter gracilis]RKR83892.1 hypothetical protein BDD43_4107 [Mucilaginibacter gracilis]